MAQEGELFSLNSDVASRWLQITPARDKVRNEALDASVNFFDQEQPLHHTLNCLIGRLLVQRLG